MHNDTSGIIGGLATMVAIALVIFMVIRRRERAIAKLGYFPCEDIPVRVTELVRTFTGYDPGGFRERSRSAVRMYMMNLQTEGDEAPICCVVAKTDVRTGGRIVFLKAYGNRRLLRIVDGIGGGMQESEYARRGLVPLEDFNAGYLSSHGVKAYADHNPDTGSHLFKSLLSPVLEFDKDAAGAAYADGYAVAWCGSPKLAHALCDSMRESAQIG